MSASYCGVPKQSGMMIVIYFSDGQAPTLNNMIPLSQTVALTVVNNKINYLMVLLDFMR
jgi:hypothetical protein